MPKGDLVSASAEMDTVANVARGKRKVRCYHVYLPTEERPTVRVEVEYLSDGHGFSGFGPYESKEFADLDAADEFMDALLGHKD